MITMLVRRAVLSLVVAVVLGHHGTSVAQAVPKSGAAWPSNEIATKEISKVRIINVAIDEAKKFSGARKCSFDYTLLKALPQFEPGSAFEYEVKVTCTSRDAEGMVLIKGQWLRSGGRQQDIEQLSFHMAG
jgi:hypothetical protein